MCDERISLSVLVPVFNEEHLVTTSLERLAVLASSPYLDHVQIIVVDDGSSDGTWSALNTLRLTIERDHNPFFQWVFVRHERNLGKGSAILTALEHATCDVSVIHDADLEYHPRDLLRIVEVFVTEKADAVFGSRFAGGDVRRVLNYRHQIGNRFLTALCNLVTNLNVTDMETCYKAVRTVVLKSIPIDSTDFRFEPELTIKLAKRNARLYEIPISYSGRTHNEGKKINWRDGYRALWAILKYGYSDNIYKRDAYGSRILARLARAPQFNAWLAETIRGFCGKRVLEIGSGVGNITMQLIPRTEYFASDINPLYLNTLQALANDRPYLRTSYCDVTDAASFPEIPGGYDTVICLNVLEHVQDDHASLTNIKRVLSRDGRAVILVPHGNWNFGTLDEALDHKRRYSKASLHALAADCGLELVRVLEFNRIGTLAWFINGKLLRRRHFGLVQVAFLNLLTPLFRVIDPFVPWPSLSIIAIMQRPAPAMSTAEVVRSMAYSASHSD